MIKILLDGHTTELEPDADGYYHVPIALRYSETISTFQKTQNAPNYTLDTILKHLGLVYVKRPPAVDYELWRMHAPIKTLQDSIGAQRFNLSGDAFGSERRT